MRIYNGKASQLDLPLTGKTRLTIPGHSVSRDFMPNDEFLELVSISFTDKDIALIVSGPFEINMCSRFSALYLLVVQSIDEAMIRFNVGKEEENIVEVSSPTTTIDGPQPVAEQEENCSCEEGPVEVEETQEESEPIATPEAPQKKKKRGSGKKNAD